jgi:hypothetical protein
MARDRRSAADTDPFLTAIDSRLAALQQLRASYLAARAAGAIGSIPPGEAAASWPAPLPGPHGEAPKAPEDGPADRPQRRGSIAAAAEACLAGASRPLRARDIAKALRAQGLVSSGASFAATITSAMHRLRARGRVVRTAGGWAIAGSPAASQPAPVEARLQPVRPKPKRPRRPRPIPQPGEPTPDRREGGLAWRIESLLRSHGQPVAARYVASATGEPLNVVGLTLGRMIRQERVEKDADGRFAVVVQNADGAERTHEAGDLPSEPGQHAIVPRT